MLNEIERAIAREYGWPGYFPEEKVTLKVAPEVLNAYIGDYAAKSGFQCSIIKEQDSLFLKSDGQPEIQLYPESELKFFMTTLNAGITFEKTAKGEVKGLVIQQEGKQTSAEKKR